MAATEKNKQTKVKWTGLGLWNVFFIGEFLLGGFGYLSLNLLQNVLLLVFVLFPIGNRETEQARSHHNQIRVHDSPDVLARHRLGTFRQST